MVQFVLFSSPVILNVYIHNIDDVKWCRFKGDFVWCYNQAIRMKDISTTNYTNNAVLNVFGYNQEIQMINISVTKIHKIVFAVFLNKSYRSSSRFVRQKYDHHHFTKVHFSAD